MKRVALGLGANLADTREALQSAVDLIGSHTEVVAVSELYRTDPVGGPEQPEYLNAVLVVRTDLQPLAVLGLAHEAEQGRGRTREVRWGPRTLDVDVLAYEDLVSDDPVLTLPHPRAAERAFVMVPWAAVDPDFVVPGSGRTVAEIANGLDASGVRPTGEHLRTVAP